jgi:hypothetical protein
MRDVIWTDEALGCLFQSLKRKFGPFEDWEFQQCPGRGFDIEFAKFLDHFKDVVGCRSAGAVTAIIAAAVTPNMNRNTIHFAIKRAAQKAGFAKPYPERKPSHSRFAHNLQTMLDALQGPTGEFIEASMALVDTSDDPYRLPDDNEEEAA